MPFVPFIVGIGGTARPESTSERAVREALAAAERMGARTRLFDGPFVAGLPLYVPGRVERNADEQALIAALRACDGVIVGTPGYHGSIAGPIKNALDLVEDMARDDAVYLEGRAFGSIVTAYGWQACGTTLVTMRSIAHALRAWPTPFAATFNASTPIFDDAGGCIDPRMGDALAILAGQVVDFARWRHAGRTAE